MVEGIFASLPVRAALFQSGRFKLSSNGGAQQVEFAHPFQQKPRLIAWLMPGAPAVMSRIPAESIALTSSGENKFFFE